MSEYTFERLNDSHLPKLVPLFKDAFGLNVSVKSIRHKFDTFTYTLKKNIAYLAVDENGEAAALYIVFPSLIYLKGDYYLSAQVGDLMTHSNHRRKGLFLKLANLTHELAENEGVKVIYTFPFGKNSSYNGFVSHLGFEHKESLNSYVLPVNTLPLCKLFYKFKFLKLFYSCYLNILMQMFYKPVFSFGDKQKNKEGHVVKDENFFKYKFSYSKGYIIRLKSSLAWFKLTKYGSMSLGDLSNYQNPDNNLRALKKFCFLAGIRAVQIETSSGTELDICLKKMAAPKNNYHICYLKLNNEVPAEEFKFVFGDLDNF